MSLQTNEKQIEKICNNQSFRSTVHDFFSKTEKWLLIQLLDGLLVRLFKQENDQLTDPLTKQLLVQPIY